MFILGSTFHITAPATIKKETSKKDKWDDEDENDDLSRWQIIEGHFLQKATISFLF